MNNYEKLKEVSDEINKLIELKVSSGKPEFIAWKNKAERLLIKIFGKDSYEHKEFQNTSFSLSMWVMGTPDSAFVNACKEGLLVSKAVFETYLSDLNEGESNQQKRKVTSNNYDKVFIVHGHDGEIKESVARLVEKQGIIPIILHEQANQGQTIIEKIEYNADVSGAICLFTADDEGKSKKENDYKQRARQNVVFEAGYFIGKFGRNKVMLIADKDIEIPSDLSGVVYSDSGQWKFSVLQELKAMGYNIDYNKID
ncbi:MAG: hypothetical protein K0R50_2367 [Eubacterium sp.]|jgi:predicted nucleotide-binding protein|nr:hypothetical protein [Eubacterium sp.]